MLKKALIAVVVLSLLLAGGCASANSAPKEPEPGSYDILRKFTVADKWHVYQLEVRLDAGSEMPIVLKLSDGDTVNGYFSVESGSLGFDIAGASQIYKSGSKAETGRVTSDRFDFTASSKQGSNYILTFRNPVDATIRQGKVTALVEVIFPVGGSIFTPLESK